VTINYQLVTMISVLCFLCRVDPDSAVLVTVTNNELLANNYCRWFCVFGCVCGTELTRTARCIPTS